MVVWWTWWRRRRSQEEDRRDRQDDGAVTGSDHQQHEDGGVWSGHVEDRAPPDPQQPPLHHEDHQERWHQLRAGEGKHPTEGAGDDRLGTGRGTGGWGDGWGEVGGRGREGEAGRERQGGREAYILQKALETIDLGLGEVQVGGGGGGEGEGRGDGEAGGEGSGEGGWNTRPVNTDIYQPSFICATTLPKDKWNYDLYLLNHNTSQWSVSRQCDQEML